MQKLLLILLVFSLSGCASGGYNVSCGNVTANGSYATATGAGSGFLCHAGYVGFGKTDYSNVTTLATAYINANKGVTTTIPLSVSVVPTGK